MLVSNEIERPITVNVRPRKSRHGGVSTQIVANEKASSTGPHAPKVQDKRRRAPERKTERQETGGGLLKKVFGTRRA
jgi:hypothetical protein